MKVSIVFSTFWGTILPPEGVKAMTQSADRVAGQEGRKPAQTMQELCRVSYDTCCSSEKR